MREKRIIDYWVQCMSIGMLDNLPSFFLGECQCYQSEFKEAKSKETWIKMTVDMCMSMSMNMLSQNQIAWTSTSDRCAHFFLMFSQSLRFLDQSKRWLFLVDIFILWLFPAIYICVHLICVCHWLADQIACYGF